MNRMRNGFFLALCLSLTICAGCGPQAKTETNPTDAPSPPKAVEEQPAENVAPKPSRESVEVVPISEDKLSHEQLRANEKYAICVRHEEMGWYIIKNSLATPIHLPLHFSNGFGQRDRREARR